MGSAVLLLFLVLSAISDSVLSNSIRFKSSNFDLNVDNFDQKSFYTLHKFGRKIQTVHLDDDFGQNLTRSEIENGFVLHGQTQDVRFEVIEDSEDFSLIKVSAIPKTRDGPVRHCVDLKTGRVNWFGGPEIFYQYWPVEKLKLKEYSYVPKQQDNVGVAERYWLSSDGGFLYVQDYVPLFIEQNINGNTLCFISKNELPYNVRTNVAELYYSVGVSKDTKVAHQKALERFLKKPTAVPDRTMVERPIWSTWAKLTGNIDEAKVDAFAKSITDNGFDNSQFEIDDNWEDCYGALSFNKTVFPNIKNLTDSLHSRGFRVTLWIHPFINKGCDPAYSEAKDKGYLVLNHQGNPDTQWWNSKAGESAYIDFTKPEAAKWYTDRLTALKTEAGIDSYKFDAGETSWLPSDPKLNADLKDHPLAMTKAYIRAVSTFGPIVEVRSAQETQDLPIFLRFLDKDSEWGFNNGLPTLITTLLQLNMVGYGFILPDMIGGNGYKGAPSEELFVRWLQANVFMPSLQYSFVPWDYSPEAITICKKYTKLHADNTDLIMSAFDETVETGEPVNPPTWWLDPEDTVAYGISDEFLLGNKILSAPVIEKGATSRHIYLPKGTWSDPNRGETYVGPTWLMDYPAGIDVLPYFILQ